MLGHFVFCVDFKDRTFWAIKLKTRYLSIKADVNKVKNYEILLQIMCRMMKKYQIYISIQLGN